MQRAQYNRIFLQDIDCTASCIGTKVRSAARAWNNLKHRIGNDAQSVGGISCIVAGNSRPSDAINVDGIEIMIAAGCKYDPVSS